MLRARHQGGSVVLEVSDDGRGGLDRERILAKARARGIPLDGDNPSDERVFSMIFEPGFSTAENVSDISGRGVGMDVVKKSVESLNGAIAIASESGRGDAARFASSFRSPSSHSPCDGLLLRVGAPQRFRTPALVSNPSCPDQSIAPRPDQLRRDRRQR